MLDEKFKIRRRMALCSFIALITIVIVVLLGAIFGSPNVGSNLNSSSGIISPAMLCFTGIIGQYAHLVYATDKEKKNENI